VTLSCDLNCSLVTYADSSVPNPTPTSCVCTAGTNWNSTDGLCWVNCSNITNAKVSVNPTTCSCVSKSYLWNSTARTCTLDCSSVPFYAAPPPGTPVPTDACTCQPFFAWDAASWKCLINCTSIYGMLPGSARLTDSSMSVCEELLLGARLYGLSADLHKVCQLEWIAHSIKEGVPLRRRVQVDHTGRVFEVIDSMKRMLFVCNYSSLIIFLKLI
jgi:hypothetical protein